MLYLMQALKPMEVDRGGAFTGVCSASKAAIAQMLCFTFYPLLTWCLLPSSLNRVMPCPSPEAIDKATSPHQPSPIPFQASHNQMLAFLLLFPSIHSFIHSFSPFQLRLPLPHHCPLRQLAPQELHLYRTLYTYILKTHPCSTRLAADDGSPELQPPGMPPRNSLTSSFSASDANNEVVCPLRNHDGSNCRKRCLGVSNRFCKQWQDFDRLKLEGC